MALKAHAGISFAHSFSIINYLDKGLACIIDQ